MKLRKTATRRPTRLRLEPLEDRNLLSVSVIESFESGSLSAYQTALRFAPSATILPIAAHDGLKGLVKQDGYEWMIRNDSGTQVHQGDTVSVWTKLADVADGRAYLGFDSHNSGDLHSFLSDGGTLAVVLAPNTNQLIIQKDSGSNGVASFSNIATASQTYQANHWYRVEATWGANGAITGRLYDSDGVTLLSTVSGTTTVPFPTGGGIAFRGFGHDKYFDTVVLDTGSTGTVSQRANAGGGLDPNWVAGNPPPPVGNGASGGAALAPWGYTSTPGSGIEVQLAAFNQLQQVAIVGDTVGLAAGNNSLITGTKQVGWGDPLETPLLAQYIFRQLPGENTQLIGASSVKHFFSSAHSDSQHLNPGENDTYGSGLNATQSLYTFGSELDPVTGTLHSPIDRGSLNADGMVVNGGRTFSSPIDLLLQVNVADLDPAQNPAGTKWYLMGNLFVGGEQDVTQASRWVEFTPQFNGTTFSFLYPNGSNGQLNFRTIPGLVDPGLSVSTATTGTVAGQPFSTITIAFDRAIQPNTFTTDQISLSGPNGAIDLTNAVITPADSSHARFTVTFAQQSTPGVYSVDVGPNILDASGRPMQQDFTTQFTIQGPQVISSVPAGNSNFPNTVDHVRVTFNEPIVSSSFNLNGVFAEGPNGAFSVTSITAVAGSNNTQFDVNFARQTKTGQYSVLILPNITDPFGNLMDQDGNFIGGELPSDIYVAQFGVTGPQVVSVAPNSTVAGEVYSLRVTFNEDIDVSSFTAGKIASFTDPNGGNLLSKIFGIVQVSPTNFRVFDILFTPQTTAGDYTMVIGPQVKDVYGNAMDQDGDAALPVGPDDQYTATFTVNGPRVISTTPTAGGVVTAPFDHVRLTFNTAVQASTFTNDQVVLLDPSGNPVNINGVTPVDFTNNTQFDVAFDAQTARGTYSLTVGPSILDAYGNAMDSAFTATYRIAVTYTASVATFQNIEIFGQAGTNTVTFTSGQVVADDDFGTINLGAGNSFTFYGQTYTSLFVSSNGLITFGSGNSAFHPTNLAGNPSQASIAPYWTDLIKTGIEPMIVWRIDGNQLTIEWYHVSLFDDRTLSMTFQTVLTLNTGGQSGDIVFNYSNVNGLGDQPEGLGVTVGVKDAGTAGDVSRTLLLDGTNFSSTPDPRVVSGHALRFHAS
jgi:methionine-rich copper-binding protein CopC